MEEELQLQGGNPGCAARAKRDQQGQVLPPAITKHAWKVFKTHPSYKIHKAEPPAWQPALQLPALLLTAYSLLNGTTLPPNCPKLGGKRGRDENSCPEPGWGWWHGIFPVHPPLINMSGENKIPFILYIAYVCHIYLHLQAAAVKQDRISNPVCARNLSLLKPRQCVASPQPHHRVFK